MTSETINTLADHLSNIDAEWRKANGYTGRAVHRRAYWQNMAARILSESIKALSQKKPKTEKTA